MSDLVNAPSDSTLVPNTAEGKLGYLLGRAVYLEGMVIGEYHKDSEPLTADTLPTGGTENSHQCYTVSGAATDTETE